MSHHCRIHGDYYGEYCNDCRREKENREYQRKEEHAEKMALLVERNNSCGRCGKFFSNNTRRFPPIGKMWIGSLSGFGDEGVCPICYYKRYRKEEIKASDAHCRRLISRVKTSDKIAEIACKLKYTHPEVAVEAEILAQQLRKQEERRREEERKLQTKEAAELRRKKMTTSIRNLLYCFVVIYAAYLIISDISSCINPAPLSATAQPIQPAEKTAEPSDEPPKEQQDDEIIKTDGNPTELSPEEMEETKSAEKSIGEVAHQSVNSAENPPEAGKDENGPNPKEPKSYPEVRTNEAADWNNQLRKIRSLLSACLSFHKEKVATIAFFASADDAGWASDINLATLDENSPATDCVLRTLKLIKIPESLQKQRNYFIISL